jgi:16S rRNA processing protein RimM
LSEPEINTVSKNRFVCIGKIVGLHGFKGVLKLQSYVESTAFFEPEAKIWVRNAGGDLFHFTIAWIKPHKKGFLLFFKEVFSDDDCQRLINAELLVERKQMPEPEDGQYYWVDLIGLSVFTMENVYLGKLEYIFSTGSNDVFVVKDRKMEKLIPALESVVKKINLTNKIMQIQLPEGL